MEIALRGDLLDKRLEESETNTVLEKSYVLRNGVFEEWQVKTGDMVVQPEALTRDTDVFTQRHVTRLLSMFEEGFWLQILCFVGVLEIY